MGSFDNDLDTILESTLVGDVQRTLSALTAIVYAVGVERFGIRERKGKEERQGQPNRRQQEIQRLREDINSHQAVQRSK